MRRHTGEIGALLFLLVLGIAAWLVITATATQVAAPIIPKIHTIPAVKPKPKPKPLSVTGHVILASKLHGWGELEQNCLIALITIENRHWNPKAKNHTSTASGIFQMLRSPSGVMARDLSVKDQVRRGVGYITARYSDSPCRALDFELSHGSY